MPSFHDLLQRRLRTDPGQPLLTFYDDATGERTELSTITYANWVAKTAGVLVEDLELDAGDSLRIDLAVHWLGPVFVGAALTAGLQLTDDAEGPDDGADAVVGHGPGATLYCALLPFAVASRDPVPAGALDFGTLWPGQPDDFLGVPSADVLGGSTPDDRRVLSEADPTHGAGLAQFLGLLAGGGSLVLVANADPAARERRTATENVTG